MNSFYKINNIKVGFTLAEVLITLGIIGVVAAMTLPTIIENHRSQVIEKKLAKFYTNMNQAFALSENENGPHENWDYTLSSYDFYNRYLAKYLNTIKVQKGYNGVPDDSRFVGIYFSDGNMAVMGYTHCINFFPKAKTNYSAVCTNTELENKNSHKYGKDIFAFIICKDAFHKFEPYGRSDCSASNSTSELSYQYIYDDCKDEKLGLYCTELIKRNGWKIPQDYPVKL